MTKRRAGSRSTYICEHVRLGDRVSVPDGFAVSHSVLVEPRRGKPYFAVLLSDERRGSGEQRPSAIAFQQF